MCSALILVPICWLKGLKHISYVSMFANFSIIFALIVIMSYNEQSYVNEPELHENIRYMDATHMPLFFGIAVFNFEGNGVVCNLHNSMKEPEKFQAIMRNVMIFVISLLCIFSISSYEAYGYRINDMVTMNLPHDNLTTCV
jgi:proton-coupled amino acid transporter